MPEICESQSIHHAEKQQCVQRALEKQAAANENAKSMLEIHMKMDNLYDIVCFPSTEEEGKTAEREFDCLEKQLIALEKQRGQGIKDAWADSDAQYP